MLAIGSVGRMAAVAAVLSAAMAGCRTHRAEQPPCCNGSFQRNLGPTCQTCRPTPAVMPGPPAATTAAPVCPPPWETWNPHDDTGHPPVAPPPPEDPFDPGPQKAKPQDGNLPDLPPAPNPPRKMEPSLSGPK